MRYENIYSCRERKDECFERKINPERISLDKDVSKILRGSLFLGHPLTMNRFVFTCT